MAVITKPAHVFDREFEWEALTGFVSSAEPDVRMGVVSGRRRQGKTYLLRALAESAGGFYFTGTETTASDSLRDFGEALAVHAGARAPFQLRDWDDAIRAVYETVMDGVIVMDEFPYLMKGSPALPSLLQRALDPRGWAQRGSRARLLLCGSAMSVMGGLLAGNAPLRGRAGLELIVQPFDYRTAAEFWNITDPRLAVLVHSIVGGTPAYRRAFTRGDVPTSLEDFDAWVVRTILNPAVPIFREARYLLAEETDIREPALYNAVLGAIAAGNATRGGIASYVGRKDSDLVHPLNVLEDSRLVVRESDPFHSRRSTFRICEPLITFYQSIMRRSWTLLEQRQAEAVWRSSQNPFFSQVVGPHFEEICRSYVLRSAAHRLGGLVSDVAKGTVGDPANRSQIQVDVAALAPGLPGERRSVLCLGEAKWNKVMGLRHLARLQRARDLLRDKGFDMSGTFLACFSGLGFDVDLRAAAAREPVLLIGLDDLYTD